MSVLSLEEILQNNANNHFTQVVVEHPNTELSFTTTQGIVEQQKTFIRNMRDKLLQKEMWRYDRHARELRLGLTPTDSSEYMLLLDAYIKELTDVPAQAGFPFEVTWPAVPK